MKKLLFKVILLMLIPLSINAQSVDREREVFNGIQLSVFPYSGPVVFNEFPLGKQSALRSEVGLASLIPFEDFVFQPIFRIEPRFYHNFDQRRAKNESPEFNNGNYFAISCLYVSEMFKLGSNRNDFTLTETLGFLPTYGIRRSLSAHLDYELGIGAGLQFIQREEVFNTNPDLLINLHARIGYRF